MAHISKLVIDTWTSVLSDAVHGFNVKHAAVAAGYGVQPASFNFNTPGQNFFLGNIDPAALEDSTAFEYPIITLDCVGADMRTGIPNRTLSATFGGRVQGLLTCHVAWENDEAPPDTFSLPASIEDALFACMNDPASIWSGNGIAYNSDMAVSMPPAFFAGNNWRRTIQAACSFNVNV